MMKSAFCGKIDEIPGISVDNFENPSVIRARAYFLSHCHTDHMQGLFSEALVDVLEKTGTCLYMSESSAAIVDHEKTDSRLMEYVRPLKLGSTSITLARDPEENLDELPVTVSMIPAGHSFGSVMFLFRTSNKTVLFTGDFRVSPSSLPSYAAFHKGMDPIKIDALYVDTTFLEHRYLNFPSRTESIQATIEVIANHLKSPGHHLALHTSARYGYEHVYNEIYKQLRMKVYVGARWSFYSKVPHLVQGVTNDEKSTRIHLCTNNTEKKDHTKCMKTMHEDQNCLYVHFSAMKWDNFEVDDNTVNKVSPNRVDVCFATHCSRSELMFFVNYLDPKRVVGFPVKFPREERKVETFKVPPKRRKVCEDVNKNELGKKVDRNLLSEMFEV